MLCWHPTVDRQTLDLSTWATRRQFFAAQAHNILACADGGTAARNETTAAMTSDSTYKITKYGQSTTARTGCSGENQMGTGTPTG